MEDVEKKIEAAVERGRFEGEVLQSLKDIHLAIIGIETKLEKKVDKKEFEKLQFEVAGLSRWRYISTGAGAVIGWILSTLSA